MPIPAGNVILAKRRKIVHVPKIIKATDSPFRLGGVPTVIQQDKIIQQHVEQVVHWTQAPAEMADEQKPVVIQCSPPVEVLFWAESVGSPAPSAPKRRRFPVMFTGFALKVVNERFRLAVHT